eukprot:12755085-Prorocentrum_lima.AAC.1
MDPHLAVEIQSLFPTREPRPATSDGHYGVWEETFEYAYAAHFPKAIHGLRRSGAAGLDGWRPAHLKVLARDGVVLELLQEIAAIWMRGKAPDLAYEWLNTAR